MNRYLRTLPSVLALAAALTFAVPALAGPAGDLVKDRREQVASVLKNEAASAERDKKVAGILTVLFDYDAMARNSMGKYWAGLKDDQKADFSAVLKQLVQRNIERNVKRTMDFNVEFLGEDAASDGVLVKTKASPKSGNDDPFEIDYQMHQVGDAWRSTDVVTEGVSMVGNYRSQFARIMEKDGFDALIKKMKDKLARDAKN